MFSVMTQQYQFSSACSFQTSCFMFPLSTIIASSPCT